MFALEEMKIFTIQSGAISFWYKFVTPDSNGIDNRLKAAISITYQRNMGFDVGCKYDLSDIFIEA